MASFYAHLGATVSSIDPAKPWAHPSAASLDSITLAQFCAQHASASAAPLIPLLLNASVRYLIGAEADEVSALWFLAFCAAGTGLQNMMAARAGGGQHLRLREGTQRIATRLAAELAPNTVRLSSPVAAIDQTSQSSVVTVTVTTTSGTTAFRGARAVLAVPTPLHRTLSFTPALPPAKQRLADGGARMGCFGKATLVYDRPWWQENASEPVGPLNAIFESILGPVIYSRSTSVPSTSHWSITGFVVGAPGRRWAALPTREERKKAVVEQLRHGFGAVLADGKEVPEPVAYVEGEWVGKKHFGGGPVPLMRPGVLTEVRGALTEPFGRVHFVGAETADVWRGYMDGAVRSGLRGADEVVGALGKEEAHQQQQQAGKL